MDAAAAVIDLMQALPAGGEAWASLDVAETEIRRFRLRRMRGITANWHAHEAADEGFLVLSGEAVIDLDEESRSLKAGEMTIIRAGRRHRARVEGEALLLVFDTIEA